MYWTHDIVNGSPKSLLPLVLCCRLHFVAFVVVHGQHMMIKQN
jgi:hypothetical protein